MYAICKYQQAWRTVLLPWIIKDYIYIIGLLMQFHVYLTFRPTYSYNRYFSNLQFLQICEFE